MYRCFACVYVYVPCASPVSKGSQTRASSPLELELWMLCEPRCGFWKLTADPLQEQQELRPLSNPPSPHSSTFLPPLSFTFWSRISLHSCDEGFQVLSLLRYSQTAIFCE